jgi:maleate isomerase
VPHTYALWRTPQINLSINEIPERAGQLRHLGFEDATLPAFATSYDVDGIEWEAFSAAAQDAEIVEVYGEPERPASVPAPLSLGMLLPSGNLVAEAQVRAMLAPEVTLHTTRLPLTGSSELQLHAMIERLDVAACLLADARVDVIAFNCTAVSTFAPEADAGIADRIRAATGTLAVTTAEALVAALRALDASRIVLVTPYLEAVTLREAAFLEHHGFDVLAHASAGIDSNYDMAQAPAQRWFDFTAAQRHADADAYLLSCTAIHSASVIAPLERALDRPVVTSNQALAWYCQRDRGVDLPGFGRLLRRA